MIEFAVSDSVMGRGLALAFKRAFPGNVEASRRACERGEVQPGRVFVFETGRPTNSKYIFNLPTKRSWREKGRLEDVESGLVDLRGEIERRRIFSVAPPALGAGLGGLPWSEVRARIDSALRHLSEVRVTVFEPHGGLQRTGA